MKLKTDEYLVREVVEGSISAFEELVTRYQHKLYGFALSIVHDHAIAQDVVQESFIRLYKTIDRIDTTKKFSSYFYTIARNAAISLLRQRRQHVPLDVIKDVPSGHLVDDQYMEQEKKAWIRAALRRLDAKYHNVISLYYFEDLSYEEISRKLRLPVNTIRTHLRRAKEALEEVLGSYEKH